MLLDRLPGNTREVDLLVETLWGIVEERGIEQEVNEG
jgi:hypothetical protein